jgi:transposase
VTIFAHQIDHVIGVDTHAKTHTLVVLDALGVKLKSDTFPTSPAGLSRARAWIDRNSSGRIAVAMEGTGSYGATFTRLLTESGIVVVEARPPKRTGRRSGKSDEIDAELAARHFLTLPPEKVGVPRSGSGDRAALQVLLTGRRARTTERTATQNALIALLRTHNLGVDTRKPITPAKIAEIARWRTRCSEQTWQATIRAEAISLARAVESKDRELATNMAGLKKHVTALAPWLLEENGIGPFVAAQLLASWSDHDRIRSEAAFARLAGVAPIPASSGNTTRHRLHRGGDRHLNHALWVVAFSRANTDPTTRDYIARRITQGKTRKEAIRCLKRYIARATYRKLQNMN